MGDRRTVLEARDPLPAGPPLHPVIQTAIWFRKAQWLMSQCAARYGDTFTLRVLHEDPWVVLSKPAHVKQVFTGDPCVFHAGEGNRILLHLDSFRWWDPPLPRWSLRAVRDASRAI